MGSGEPSRPFGFKNIKRIIIKTALFLLVTLILVLIYSVWQNNRPTRQVTQDEIRFSLNKSIEWLENNKADILEIDNVMLWWMINESALITNDERLLNLSDRYKHIFKTKYPESVWDSLFEEISYTYIDPVSIANLPYYTKLFIFGLTCSEELAELDIIKEQNDTDFCWKSHPFSPACITHQLMGFMFMQRKDCRNDKLLLDKISKLQKYIILQLSLDFRVVDVYIQRVLVLADSGLKKQIKPIWLRKIIDAQLEDGGWGGFHGLIPVGNSKYFGFSNSGLSIKKPESNFHTTAQGVFLMSIMQN